MNIPEINKPITRIDEVVGENAEHYKIGLQYIYDGQLRCTENGRIFNYKTGNWIGSLNKDYICINFHGFKLRVHILIQLVFNGPIPEKYVVNHKDLNKQNNHKDNIEAITKSDNTKHTYKNKTVKFGKTIK